MIEVSLILISSPLIEIRGTIFFNISHSIARVASSNFFKMSLVIIFVKYFLTSFSLQIIISFCRSCRNKNCFSRSCLISEPDSLLIVGFSLRVKNTIQSLSSIVNVAEIFRHPSLSFLYCQFVECKLRLFGEFSYLLEHRVVCLFELIVRTEDILMLIFHL